MSALVRVQTLRLIKALPPLPLWPWMSHEVLSHSFLCSALRMTRFWGFI